MEEAVIKRVKHRGSTVFVVLHRIQGKTESTAAAIAKRGTFESLALASRAAKALLYSYGP